METALFTVLIALSFFSLYKDKYFLALLFGFLCSIVRIDGLSVAFIVFIFIFIKKRIEVFKYFIIPFLLYICWEIFLDIYYGSFIPNSMIAKLVLYSGHQDSIFPNLELIISKFFVIGYFSSSIITILFLGGIYLVIKKKLHLIDMISWFIIYYLALILSKTHIFAWYLIPPLFVFITISGISIIFISKWINDKLNFKYFNLIVFIGITLFSTLTLYLKIVQIKTEYNYEQEVRVKLGKYLDENTPKNASVFLEPIGIIGYYSNRYIYDDAALISPQFLDLNRLPNTPETRFKKIELVKPDYLVIRDRYLNEFYSKTKLKDFYQSVKTFNYPSNSNSFEFPSLTLFKKK
jgi:hypothetical protein